MTLKEFIKSRALDLGFSAAGVTTAEPVDCAGFLGEASRSGRIASMRWLARDAAGRCDPGSLLAGARSVICCALGYGEGGITKFSGSTPPRPSPYKGEGVTARFARGEEYHEVVRAKLEELWGFVAGLRPAAKAKICVDTSPILEKALAERAGLGWIGKNTLLVNERLGSFFVLGEIITDLAVEPDVPREGSCGECRLCMDACPTSALIAPRVMDSRLCLSYLTIEAPRGAGSRGASTGHGCDICQEACPYNFVTRDR